MKDDRKATGIVSSEQDLGRVSTNCWWVANQCSRCNNLGVLSSITRERSASRP